MNNRISSIWLTTNRACNLKCTWCYAEDSDPRETMKLSQAKKIVNFSKQVGTNNIFLIGGEPTLYPHMTDLLREIEGLGLSSTLVTNGISLSDKSMIDKLVTAGLTRANISIKAESDREYLNLCGIKAYSDVVQALQNLKEGNLPFGVSLVISKYNYTKLPEIMAEISKVYDGTMQLSFCRPTFNTNGFNSKNDCSLMPKEYISEFQKAYHRIDTILKGKLSLHQGLPLCMWEKEIIHEMNEKGQLTSVCHIYERSGLVFNTQGEVLMCNAVPHYPIGKFEDSFWDEKSFDEFWEDPSVKCLYEKLTCAPSKTCTKCNDYLKCGGGCAMQWFKYDFNEMKG